MALDAGTLGCESAPPGRQRHPAGIKQLGAPDWAGVLITRILLPFKPEHLGRQYRQAVAAEEYWHSGEAGGQQGRNQTSKVHLGLEQPAIQMRIRIFSLGRAMPLDFFEITEPRMGLQHEFSFQPFDNASGRAAAALRRGR